MRRTSIALIGASIISVWLITPAAVIFLVGSEGAGAFGDIFGSINALFSGLAFAALIAALYMQREELSLQRNELTLTRLELQRASQAQEKAGDYLAEQAQVMKVAAHLNGLATLIHAASAHLDHLQSPHSLSNQAADEIEKVVQSRKDNMEELDNLMHAIRCAKDF
jgi:hypothetical protein